MKTVTGDFNDISMIWELRGNYPNIANYEGIDIAELTKGDEDPMFLTLPIGEADSISGNKRLYDNDWLTELERQVETKKPIGIMGHLREDDLATEFPPEAIHWVGTQRVNEILWGKGYVPPGEARDRVRRYKATNKSLATSIFAHAKGVWDSAKNAYHMAAKSMDLHQIDIGPADRVGVASLARVPGLTAEMENKNNGVDDTPEEETMDKLTVINEMTADDAHLLPQPVADAILATVEEAPEIGIVAEMCEALGVKDGAELADVIKEMKEEKETAAQTAVSDRIQELVTNKETGIKLETARGIVTELVTAKQPQTAEEADAAYKEVVESDSVKAVLEMTVKAQSGPSMETPAQGKKSKSKYFDIPKEAE